MPADLPSTEFLSSRVPAGPLPEGVGAVLAGRYRLSHLLGQGGMGAVFQAEQFEPVRRGVAVKVIRPGKDTATVLARFEAERQALARMDHPHIAKVLDAGTTPAGRPFFIMELVRGVPLTDYCAAVDLPLPARLALLARVCRAVQHAHQKGVIHRDLKPGNILVAVADGAPEPKVIDFGLAKALGPDRLGPSALETADGAVVGTPNYMAPEQAGGDPADVDTRADVYALGAILYELLTGTPPIDRGRLARLTLAEAVRVIREEDPPAPSRRPGPGPVGPLPVDLDWVALKALAKDPAGRYESAAALADDLDRFLAHEPVRAGPPSGWYRVRKFVRRHRPSVAAAALVLAALSAGAGGTAWGLVRAQASAAEARTALGEEARQRVEVEAERDRANEAEARATRAAGQAGREAKRAVEAAAAKDRVVQFLTFDLLNYGNPTMQAALGLEPDPDVKVRTLAARAVKAVGDRFRDQPDVEGDLLDVLGTMYGSLGDYRTAVGLHERALDRLRAAHGPDDDRALAALSHLAGDYTRLGQIDRAREVRADVVARTTRLYGADDARSVDAALFQAGSDVPHQPATAERVARKALADRDRLPPITTSFALNILGRALFQTGRYKDAEAVFRDQLALEERLHGPVHPFTITTRQNVGTQLERQGRLPEAEAEYLRVLADTKTVYPADSRVLHMTTKVVADHFLARKEYAREETYRAEQAAVSRRIFGPDHVTTLLDLSELGICLWRQQKFKEAEPVYKEVLARAPAVYGPDDRRTVTAKLNVAAQYLGQGRKAEAFPLYLEVIEYRHRAAAGKGAAEDPRLLKEAAGLARDVGRLDIAQTAWTWAADALARDPKPDEAAVFTALMNVGQAARDRGKYDEAVPPLDRALTLARRVYGPASPQAYDARGYLRVASLEVGRDAAVLDLYRDGLANPPPAPHKEAPAAAAATLKAYGLALIRQGKYADAEEPLRRAVTILAGAKAADGAAMTRCLLGRALAGQKKYPEAEAELLAAYRALEGVKDLLARRRTAGSGIPPSLTPDLAEEFERIGRLYDDWGKPDQAKAWRGGKKP